MSAPVVIVIAVATLGLAVPVIAASEALLTQQQLWNATENAALAAADAANGWNDAEPCQLAAEVLTRAGAELISCEIAGDATDARVQASVATIFGVVRARARAGIP